MREVVVSEFGSHYLVVILGGSLVVSVVLICIYLGVPYDRGYLNLVVTLYMAVLPECILVSMIIICICLGVPYERGCCI